MKPCIVFNIWVWPYDKEFDIHKFGNMILKTSVYQTIYSLFGERSNPFTGESLKYPFLEPDIGLLLFTLLLLNSFVIFRPELTSVAILCLVMWFESFVVPFGDVLESILELFDIELVLLFVPLSIYSSATILVSFSVSVLLFVTDFNVAFGILKALKFSFFWEAISKLFLVWVTFGDELECCINGEPVN